MHFQDRQTGSQLRPFTMRICAYELVLCIISCYITVPSVAVIKFRAGKKSICAVMLCAGYFPLAPSACVVWATMDVLLCTASIWHMCTMSLDRYCTLRYPISYGRSRTRTGVALKIAFVWVISTAVSAALAVHGFADVSNVYVERQCVPAVKDFILYGSILAFYVPLAIMVITYVMTVRILAENRRTMESIGLQSSARDGAERKPAGSGSDCIARRPKWDGPVASMIGHTPRGPTDGPLTGRYRRKSATLISSPAHAAKPPALRRNARVDDHCNAASSRRRYSDGNLGTVTDGGGSNGIMTIYHPYSITLSLQPLPRDADPQAHSQQDHVPQPGWVTSSSDNAAYISPSPSDGCEQQLHQSAVRQYLGSSLLKPDRLASSCCRSPEQAASGLSNVLADVDNICEHRRRMSDGVLSDCGVQTGTKNPRQKLDGGACRSSVWSLAHRRRPTDYVELRDTMTADLKRTWCVASRTKRSPTVAQTRTVSARSFATESSRFQILMWGRTASAAP